MRPELKHRGLITLIVCITAFVSGALMSSETLMSKLPLYDRYRCELCHSTATPIPGNADLNAFGRDFQANGNEWDATLARKDSDGDGASNGFELGDQDGDGTPDKTATEERSNPGNPLDTPSSVDEKSWGIIKKLFADQK